MAQIVASALVLMAVAGSLPASANLLANPGFEDAAPQVFLPNATGYWSGDPTTRLGSEGGITPLEGSFMLRFDQTFWSCPTGASGADLSQLVTVDPGTTSLTVQASFNRVAASTDTLFQASIFAFAGSSSGFDDNSPAIPSSLDRASVSLLSDADPSTWETVSVTLYIPGGTTYVAVIISAVENISNDPCPGEFAGHYADHIVLTAEGPPPPLPPPPSPPPTNNLLVNGSFEGDAPSIFLPSAPGSWSGDPASKVATGLGITPLDGQAMLRFDDTFWDCQASAAAGSDLHQIVLPSPGVTSYTLFARFNRVAGSTDSLFAAGLRAFDGDPSEYDDFSPNIPPALTTATVEVLSDADPATWETVTVSLSVPPETTYLSVTISAIENISNDACPGEFAGHYADDIGLFATPAVPSMQAPFRMTLVVAIAATAWLAAVRLPRRGRSG